jgi:hypothetical protein
LLLIGINPGGSKSYKEALKEKGYDKRPASDLGYKENTLVEKPEWETWRGSDDMRNSLKRVFNADNNLDILNDTVMMNMFYFNTGQEKDIAGIESEIRKYCIDKTLEFIEILNPQNILFFTSNADNLKSCGVKNIMGKDTFIKQGTLGNRTVYTIPHYRYRPKPGTPYPYSIEDGAKIGKVLSEIFN